MAKTSMNPVCRHCGYSFEGLRPQGGLYHCPECGMHTGCGEVNHDDDCMMPDVAYPVFVLLDDRTFREAADDVALQWHERIDIEREETFAWDSAGARYRLVWDAGRDAASLRLEAPSDRQTLAILVNEYRELLGRLRKLPRGAVDPARLCAIVDARDS